MLRVLPPCENVELGRVSGERGEHELGDRRLDRARVARVRNEGRPVVGGVVGAQVEGPVDDLPQRVRGVGAEVAGFGLAREEGEDRAHRPWRPPRRRTSAPLELNEVVIDLYAARRAAARAGASRRRTVMSQAIGSGEIWLSSL